MIFEQGNPITGQIKDARIRILGQETPITIKIVEGNGEILLLEKDWWKKYSAIMDMEKSTFSLLVNGKRHVTKITEEKNPKVLLNYLTEEQEDLSEEINQWFENPYKTSEYQLSEQKSLRGRIEEWMKKVEH
jgi:hypothetical protein